MVSTPSPPKVVVLGLMTKSPVAGVIWQTVHYLLGLQRLGCDVYYVEAHARAPGMFTGQTDDGSARAAGFISDVMQRFGLGDRWAYHALHSDGRCYGMSDSRLQRLYAEAALILNLSGGTKPLHEHSATGRLVFLETDPVRLQIELADDEPEAISYLEPHCAFYTFAENYGTSTCPLPTSGRFDFRPTRQPVVLDRWEPHGIPSAGSFTTVGNWRQRRRDVEFGGETYYWSKHHEFEKVLDLPRRSGQTFELALARYMGRDRKQLEAHGWTVRDAAEVSGDVETYRHYVSSSHAEFTVAKDQNVRFRTGWFSDRSATYLAAGRPVVTQDTAFGNILPTGAGLFAFSSVNGALAAVEEITADYTAQSQAAASIAREYFAHDVVLGPLLDDLGITPKTTRRPRVKRPFPDDLAIAPVARRPLRMPEATVQTVLAQPLPRRLRRGGSAGNEISSIVVVTHNKLFYTRLCLESLLANTEPDSYEVIVIDNASTDGTARYLLDLAQRRSELRVHFNDRNRGFAAGNNRGMAEARGDVLVLLNNDTIVPPGWLESLRAHLDDSTVGLVGPVTNRTCNEAQIETSYTTYRELLAFADGRRTLNGSASFDIRMLAMFCVAMRRDIFEDVGPLDERFGLGTLEDEDYAIRVRESGRRVVCAEDVFVHHFGHASFDDLLATGAYHDLRRHNQRLFEEKWGVRWRPYARRRTEGYEHLTQRVRHIIVNELPSTEGVAVVSKGDDDLLPSDGRRAWHFPQSNGTYSGFHPADDAEAIDFLESVRHNGAGFLVIPNSSRWWLHHYAGFRDHLEDKYRAIVDDPSACVVYALHR